MRWCWLRGLGLALGLWAGANAAAQEAPGWDPPADAGRAVALGKPRPLFPAPAYINGGLRTVSHEVPDNSPGPLLEGPLLVPSGPPAAGPAPTASPVVFPVVMQESLPARTPGPANGPAFAPFGVEAFPAGPPCDWWCDPIGFAANRAYGRVYGGAEYLLWWIRDSRLPPLVTTTPATVSQTIQGALTAPGTQVLFGGDNHSNGTFSGGRFTAGVWVDPCALCGVEGTFFFLGRQTRTFQANSDQFPVLGRPIFNLNAMMEDRQLTTTPGTAPGDLVAAQGHIRVDTSSQLWGAEVNLRRRLLESCDFRLDVLAGFRYLELKEALQVQEDILFTRNATTFTLFNPGNHFVVTDSFSTRNQFYGGQVGAEAMFQRGRWLVDVTGKVALGVNEQTININGSQILTTSAGATTAFTGGLLAVPSNIGHHTRDRFAVVPEVGVKLGYQLTEWCRATVGYNFLYMSNVVRPGDQIDRVIDVTQVPNFVPPGVTVPPNTTGVPRPLVPFRESNFWAQGVTFGLEFRY